MFSWISLLLLWLSCCGSCYKLRLFFNHFFSILSFCGNLKFCFRVDCFLCCSLTFYIFFYSFVFVSFVFWFSFLYHVLYVYMMIISLSLDTLLFLVEYFCCVFAADPWMDLDALLSWPWTDVFERPLIFKTMSSCRSSILLASILDFDMIGSMPWFARDCLLLEQSSHWWVRNHFVGFLSCAALLCIRVFHLRRYALCSPSWIVICSSANSSSFSRFSALC